MAVNLMPAMAKEIVNTPKLKENIEQMAISEMKEIRNSQEKIAQPADVETAKSVSLSSLLEDNKEKRELEASKYNEVESREVREGLSDEQKVKIREMTGWSNEILDVIGSREESEIYIKARLQEVEVNGKKCLIRDDIDIDQADEDGIINRDRMERGRPPITKNGEEVELHHIGQKQSSPLAELTMEQHRGVGNDTILHIKTKETEIDRIEFGRERRDYWKNRVGSMEGVI